MLEMLPEDNKYRWMGQVGNSMTPLEVVHLIIKQLNTSRTNPIISVYTSDKWAVCASYCHYKKEEGFELTEEQLEYTKDRQGILSKKQISPFLWQIISIRDYLETRDVGFAGFSHHHDGVDAA